MHIERVTPQLSVSSQVLTTDIAAIHEQGFKSIICNRPDGESADQPGFADIEKEAGKYGIACKYQPVNSATLTRDDAARFADSLAILPGPTLAYCRTGTRCITLWAMANLPSLGDACVLTTAQRAGYDLSELVGRLKHSDIAPEK